MLSRNADPEEIRAALDDPANTRMQAAFDSEFGHQAFDSGGPRWVNDQALTFWWITYFERCGGTVEPAHT